MRSNLFSLFFLILLFLTLSACGSPRGDGIPWESTYPHVGDTVAEVNKLYGKPYKQTREASKDTNKDIWLDTYYYKNWRAKNEFNGLMHGSDKHKVIFISNICVAWE